MPDRQLPTTPDLDRIVQARLQEAAPFSELLPGGSGSSYASPIPNLGATLVRGLGAAGIGAGAVGAYRARHKVGRALARGLFGPEPARQTFEPTFVFGRRNPKAVGTWARHDSGGFTYTPNGWTPGRDHVVVDREHVRSDFHHRFYNAIARPITGDPAEDLVRHVERQASTEREPIHVGEIRASRSLHGSWPRQDLQTRGGMENFLVDLHRQKKPMQTLRRRAVGLAGEQNWHAVSS